MSSLHRLAMAAALTFIAAAGGCALIGYNFDDYVAGGMGGAGATNSATNSAMSSATNSATNSAGSGAGGASACDCQAPPCQNDHTCADAPPTGWNGPVALYTGSDMNFVCPAPFDEQVLAGGFQPQGAPASCSKCACGTDACGPLSIELWGATNCGGGVTLSAPGVAQGCESVSTVSTGSVKVQTVQVAGGTCTASGGQPSLPPASFMQHAALCRPSQGGATGCGAGSCLPDLPASLHQTFCVYQTGALPCPPGYPSSVLFGALDDTRGCSACSCGPPAATCDVSVGFYQKDLCQGILSGSFADDGNCHDLISVSDIASVSVTAGSPCAPTQVMPVGSVGIKAPITVCCK